MEPYPRDYVETLPFKAEPSTAKAIGYRILATAIGLGAMGALAGMCAWATSAFAHEAPTGWSYPFACCSNMDCRAIDPARVKETRSGYMMPTGEIIAYSGDKRLKDSPDGQYHWCSVAGAEDSRTLCFFAPPKSY